MLNDGSYDTVLGQNLTSNASYAANIIRGVNIVFTENIVLKTIKLFYSGGHRYGGWHLECRPDGASWISVADFDFHANSGSPLTFNSNGSISCKEWRIYISAWTPSDTNVYLGEVEAYKYTITP